MRKKRKEVEKSYQERRNREEEIEQIKIHIHDYNS